MANRQTGTVIIIDSAMGNVGIFGVETGNTINRMYYVNAIAFEFSNTLGTMVLTQENTSNHIAKFTTVFNAAYSSALINPALIHFSSPQQFENLKVPTLTAGTGWIYLA